MLRSGFLLLLLALPCITSLAMACESDAELLPIHSAVGDGFGWAVDVAGDQAIIGQPGDDTRGVDAGAAWTAHWDGASWVLDGVLRPSTSVPGGAFGYAVAIDGDLAAVGAIWDDGGAPSSGVVFIFVRELGVWREEARLVPASASENDGFGSALALSGESLLVGTPFADTTGVDAGAAHVFRRDLGTWFEQAQLVPPGLQARDGFGTSVALDLPSALVGAPYADSSGELSGSAWAFVETLGEWLPDGQLTPVGNKQQDGLGWAVALDADLAVVSSIWDDDAGIDAGSVAVFRRLAGTWALEQEVVAAGGAAGDGFGWDLSLNGGVLLVGVAWEDSLGPNSNSGAVHSLTMQAGEWREDERLIPANLTWAHGLGQAVAHEADKALLGALWDDTAGSDAGAVTAFDLNGRWREGATLVAPDAAVGDGFGWSAASEGVWAVLGAPWDDLAGESSGTLHIFENTAGSWSEKSRVSPPGLTEWDAFGYSVAVGQRWLAAAVLWDDTGGLQAGAVQVYEESGGDWSHVTKLLAPDAAAEDGFGHGLALDGDRLVVGAPWDDDLGAESGSAHVYEWDTDTWRHRQKLLGGSAGDGFGHVVAISGDTVAVGAPWTDAAGVDSGAVHVFVHDGTSWQPEQVIVPSLSAAGDAFGITLDLQGGQLVVGAPYADLDGAEAGASWLFERIGGVWLEQARLVAPATLPADGSGWAVALHDGRAIVSSLWSDSAGLEAGSVDVFVEGGGTWQHLLRLEAPDAQPADGFGHSVALNAGTALVGALWHDEAGSDAGAAYISCAHVPETICDDGIDQDADGLTDCDDTDCVLLPPCESEDFDGDGVVNSEDCAALESGAFAVPGSIEPLLLRTTSSTDVVVSWTDPRPSSGSSTSVGLAAGELSSLPLAGLSAADCAALVTTAAEWLGDASMAGEARYVLARPENVCGPFDGSGWGRDSEGMTRVIDCP